MSGQIGDDTSGSITSSIFLNLDKQISPAFEHIYFSAIRFFPAWPRYMDG
jgi:hypothetical protein